jgi:hypothetical protein
MLEEILGYIHNFFIKEVYGGKFNIHDGNVDVDFLQNNQYFRIVGSVFNDGVYKYPETHLISEEFEGEVWALAIPPALLKVVDEIAAWVAKYGGVDSQVMSPYNSESFGGYSYTKSAGYQSDGGSNSHPIWWSAFGPKLNQWRKIG